MQVARRNGRPILRDGYHRAVWLLSRGITVVPAFVCDFGPFEDTNSESSEFAEGVNSGRPCALPGTRSAHL